MDERLTVNRLLVAAATAELQNAISKINSKYDHFGFSVLFSACFPSFFPTSPHFAFILVLTFSTTVFF